MSTSYTIRIAAPYGEMYSVGETNGAITSAHGPLYQPAVLQALQSGALPGELAYQLAGEHPDGWDDGDWAAAQDWGEALTNPQQPGI